VDSCGKKWIEEISPMIPKIEIYIGYIYKFFSYTFLEYDIATGQIFKIKSYSKYG